MGRSGGFRLAEEEMLARIRCLVQQFKSDARKLNKHMIILIDYLLCRGANSNDMATAPLILSRLSVGTHYSAVCYVTKKGEIFVFKLSYGWISQL